MIGHLNRRRRVAVERHLQIAVLSELRLRFVTGGETSAVADVLDVGGVERRVEQDGVSTFGLPQRFERPVHGGVANASCRDDP